MGKKFLYGIAVAILVILVTLGLSLWQYQRIQDTGQWVAHTNLVLFQTGHIMRTETQFELKAKNFLLTRDTSFLQAAGDTLAALPMEIDSLRNLIADNPAQRPHVDSITLYAARDKEAVDTLVQLNNAGILTGPAVLHHLRTMDSFCHDLQTNLFQMEAEERRLLNIRRQANLLRASELKDVLWGLIVAFIILAVFIFRKLKLDIVQEKLAMERLQRFNAELADEVHRQTARLQASEEKYKTLFYKSPLPKWIYDEDTLAFLEVNDAAVQMYGYTQDEFLKMSLGDIRPPEDVPRLMKDIQVIRSNPESYISSQWRHVKKNGEIMDVLLSAFPVQLDGRRARLVTVNDITQRKRYELTLERLNIDLAKRAGELAASNSELERFAYIASHDLQEPLRMITSFLQLLQKKYKQQLDSKADQYIYYAVDGAERMKALIMDLLEYSRVGTGKESFTNVDMRVVMRELGDIFREQIIATKARVEIDPLPVVWGDKVQLTQLIQNLLSNALKYHSERPPEIHIKCREETGCWLFSVQDNGIGIDPQFFDKIFIIFQRLHNKNDYSGTGIGLAICKKIVERHGGRIWVESVPDQGSTFYFTITKKI